MTVKSAAEQSGAKIVLLLVRRLTRFAVAGFLWLHAVFFWNPQTRLLATTSRLLHLSVTEVALLILLCLFSILFFAGWWDSVKSALYVYCFPIILLWYMVVLLIFAL